LKKYNQIVLILILLVTFSFSSSNVSAQEETPNLPVYIVQPGDSINLIALKFNVSSEDLMLANGISDPNFLQVNAQLIIPGISGASGVLAFHPVQLGETAISIARKSNLDLTSLYKINRITSPSEFYLGSNIIYSQPKDSLGSFNEGNFITQIKDQNEIEASIINQTNKWALLQRNQLEYSWQFLSDDLYINPNESSNEPQTNIEFIGLPLTQGETAAIKILSAQEVITANINDYQLNFEKLNDQFVTIFGIHAFHQPGLYPIHIEYLDQRNNKLTIDQFIIIQSGFYVSDPALYVDPSTLDPSFTEPEEDLLRELTANTTPTKYWDGLFVPPVDEPICIKSWFGNRRSYNDGPFDKYHTGVDYGVCANLNVYAPAAGTVVFSGPLAIRGNATIIDHGLGVYSGFWHQESTNVKVGDFVEQRQLIGTIGNTGRSTGPHLHWELITNGIQVNPLDWLINEYP
jgi:murein DD-endopeptidase MepM/ murein hydrolase activator NlpD